MHALIAAYAVFTLYAAAMAVRVARYYAGDIWVDALRFGFIALVAGTALVLIRPSRERDPAVMAAANWIRDQIGPQSRENTSL